MKLRPDLESFLEISLALVGLLLLAGTIVMLAGRAAGKAHRAQRHAEGPPQRGTIPPERHQNIGSVATR